MHVAFFNYTEFREFHPGISALSAFLKREGHSTAIKNLTHLSKPEEFLEFIRRENPDLLAFTVMTFQWDPVKKLSALAKEHFDLVTVVGGYHPTFFPDEVIRHPSIDYLVRGEGELPLLELVRALGEGKGVRTVPNLWAKDKEGRVDANEVRPLIQDLDSLPFWDRDLFDFHRLLTEPAKATLAHTPNTMPVAAGRGCPYRCTYCCNGSLIDLYRGKGKFVRHRSVGHLLREMRDLKERYNVKIFEFYDEQIEVNFKWLQELAERYPKEVGIPFSVCLRVENANRKTLSLLRKAGCYSVWLGIECGNEKYRIKMLNRHHTNEQILKAFKLIKELGLQTVVFNMIGLPYETKEMIRETIALNREIWPNALLYFTFQAFRGTPLYELCKKEGFLPEKTSYWYEVPDSALIQPSLPKEDLIEVWKEFRELQREIEEGEEGGWK